MEVNLAARLCPRRGRGVEDTCVKTLEAPSIVMQCMQHILAKLHEHILDVSTAMLLHVACAIAQLIKDIDVLT